MSGWVGDYWLATASDLKRLVPREPEVRYSDRNSIRWQLVASVASDVLRAARVKVGDDRSPVKLETWNLRVTVSMPEPLRSDEAHIAYSLFSDPAVADYGSEQVVNGRHRMYFARQSGATHLPVQSTRASDWSHSLFGDPDCTTLALQTFECARLFGFRGQCHAWRNRPGADVDFIDSLADAVDVAEGFLDAVAADAAKADPRPRRLPRS